MHYRTECPVCGSTDLRPSLAAIDYTVSQEVFDIQQCAGCSLRITQNIPDESGIGAYYRSDAYISHTDTRKGLMNRLYHLIRKKTLIGKRNHIRQYAGLQQGSILDIGCGTGAFLNTMQMAGWQVIGLEPDETASQNARTLYGLETRSPEHLYSMDVHSIDVVTMWHVLEHVHRLSETMSAIGRVIRPDGTVFIAVPNYTSLDAVHYGAAWAAYDVPRHLYHFSPESMHVLLERHGFTFNRILPMWYDSFYVSMLSERYQGGSMISAFLTGLRSNINALRDKSRCSSLIYVAKRA